MNQENQDRLKRELSNWYKGYKLADIDNLAKFIFSKKNCEEAVEHYYDDDECESPLDFNNWEELIQKGNWHKTQDDVNESCIDMFRYVLASNDFWNDKDNRVFVGRHRGYISYWLYTRDLLGLDYEFSYKNKFSIWLFWQTIKKIRILYWRIKNRISNRKY